MGQALIINQNFHFVQLFSNSKRCPKKRRRPVQVECLGFVHAPEVGLGQPVIGRRRRRVANPNKTHKKVVIV